VSQTTLRDYGLSGPNNEMAKQKGLASAEEWYQTPIPRQRMRELTKRRDGPAIRDTILWFGLLIASGTAGYQLWGTWWAVPAFLLYGILYTAADARWHECGHGTAFKTSWMNEVVFYIASFMMMRQVTVFRWSHQRHHSDTYVVGRDPEMYPRPNLLRKLYMAMVNLYGPPNAIKRIFLNAFGKLHPDERDYVPASEYRKVFWEARIYLLIIFSVFGYSIYAMDIRPALYIVTPLFYGFWLFVMYATPQHAGLHEDVLDHRLNSRTIYLNPFLRFLYLNMNYHTEHHMFPLVPYHALPKLHEEVKHDYPKPNPSLFSAFREVIYAHRMQGKDPWFVIERPLPPTANPYYYGPSPYLKMAKESSQQAG
jgi:fatty acid desaturase